jgi:hypothetical protein
LGAAKTFTPKRRVTKQIEHQEEIQSMKIVDGTNGATASRIRSGVSSLLAAIAFAGLSTSGNADPIADQQGGLPRVSQSEAARASVLVRIVPFARAVQAGESRVDSMEWGRSGS